MFETLLILSLQLPAYHWVDQDQYVDDSFAITLSTDNWSGGAFRNSYGDTSMFIAKTKKVSDHTTLFFGVANGYEKDQYASDGYLPVLGAKFSYQGYNAVITPAWISFGYDFVISK